MSAGVKLNIGKAVKMIEACREFAHILPEVGTNIAMALPNAKTLEEVAGLTGRIIYVENRAVGVGEPKFGATRFMGVVLLTAMRHNPKFRAVINIKYSSQIVKVCEALGMEVKTYEWGEKPKEAIEMKCTIPYTIDKLQRASEVIYDLGDVGVEALVTIFGHTAIDVARKAIRIARRYAEKR